LLAVSGPGEGTLTERLEETGMPDERLRAWAPYLEVAGQRRIGPEAHLRLRGQGAPGEAVRSDVRMVVEGGRFLCRLEERTRWNQGGTSTQGDRDLLTRLRPLESASIWFGAVTAGIVGVDPWDDPLSRAGLSVTASPRLRIRHAQSAEGWLTTVGPVALGRWTQGEKRTHLLGLFTERFGAWSGRRDHGGRGAGACAAFDPVVLAGSVHQPSEGTQTVRLAVHDRNKRRYALLAWAAGERNRQERVRLDAGSVGMKGDWVLTIRTALILRQSLGSLTPRGSLVAGHREAGGTLALTGRWDERASHLQSVVRRAVGKWQIHCDLRGHLARDGIRYRTEVGVRSPAAGGSDALSLLYRDDPSQSWPGVAGAGGRERFALRIIRRVVRAGLSARFELLVPFEIGGRPHVGATRWRIQLEQRKR
jgi:hypothetical protein